MLPEPLAPRGGFLEIGRLGRLTRMTAVMIHQWGSPLFEGFGNRFVLYERRFPIAIPRTFETEGKRIRPATDQPTGSQNCAISYQIRPAMGGRRVGSMFEGLEFQECISETR